MNLKNKIKHTSITLFIFLLALILVPLSLLPNIIISTIILSLLILILPFKIKRAKIPIINIKHIYPHYSNMQIFTLYFKIMRYLSIFLSEYIKSFNPFSKIRERSINPDCHENIEFIAKKYKDSPCFFFTMHFGNWEIMSKYFYNLDNSFVVTGKAQKHFWSNINKNRGTDVIQKDKNMIKSILSNIKNKKHICSMFDQKQKNGFNLKFMGHDCSTPNVLPKLALKYKIPIVLLYVIKEKNNKYSIKMNDITNNINYKDQSEENLKSLCQDINDYFSNIVFATPQQWFCWLYKRWDINYP